MERQGEVSLIKFFNFLFDTLQWPTDNQLEKISAQVGFLAKKFEEFTPADHALTPSEACKSTPAHKREFNDLLGVLGLARKCMTEYITILEGMNEDRSPEFLFRWLDHPEQDAYDPFAKYLVDRYGVVAINVGNGEYLSDRLLFDVALHTLRPQSSLSVLPDGSLQKPYSLPARLRFLLKGRTDIVCMQAGFGIDNLCRERVQLAFEIKTVKDMSDSIEVGGGLEKCLREAFLQLVGLNAYSPYLSPAVILTNVNRRHFLMYLEKVSDNPLRFKLIIKKSDSLNGLMKFFMDNLQNRESCTYDLGRAVTPVSSTHKESPPKNEFQADDEEDLPLDSTVELIQKINFDEVEEDEN